MPKNSDTDSPFECYQLLLGPSFLKDFIILLISDYERTQNRQLYTYSPQITVLDMSRQESTLFITKPRSNKPFHKFLYHRHAALDLTYRIFFNLRTTSNFPTSLLESLGVSMNTVSPLEIYA